MPKYEWKLKETDVCTDCPLHRIQYASGAGTFGYEDLVAVHDCGANYYTGEKLKAHSFKERPEKCKEVLGL